MINPWLLWFLPLALIPVILHLITRLRLRTVELSTFRFLMDGYVQQRRRMRLLEWLVMLLRTAFVVLIIFALSRPVLDRLSFFGSGSGGRDVTIIVDAGPSMALRTAGTTSLRRAKGAAETLLGRLTEEDYVRLIRAGAEAEVLAEGFASDLERLTERLRGIESGSREADLAGALRAAGRIGQHGAPYLFVFSDGMARRWSALEGHPAVGSVDRGAHVVMMDVGPADPPVNLAVVGEPPRSERMVKGLPVPLTATVVNGAGRAVETTLTVTLEDRVARRVDLSLSAGARRSVSLHVTPERAGLIRGRFELPTDAFADDDAYRFALNVQRSLEVLLVSGPGGEAPSERAVTYLTAALESPREVEQGIGSTERRVAEAIVVRAIDHAALGPGDLDGADVVVLADAPLDGRQSTHVRQYVEGGGGVWVMPGEHVSAESYNRTLLGSGSGWRYAPPTGDPEDESGFAAVTSVQLAHPVLAGFAADHDEKEYFSTVRVGRRFGLERTGAMGEAGRGGSDGRGGSVLLRLADGSPLLVEQRMGRGRWLLMAAPATPGWSSLPIGREFVPMVLRAMPHLQRLPEAVTRSVVRPGEPAPIEVSGRWDRAGVAAVGPDGRPHTVELHRDGERLVGAMSATERPGDYRFVVTPNYEGAPAEVELGFAVNLETGGAGFERIAGERVAAMFEPRRVETLSGTSEDPMLTAQLTEKREVWRTLIWITFAVIGAEFVLSTLRPRSTAAQEGVGPQLGGEAGGSRRALRFGQRLRQTLSAGGASGRRRSEVE